MAENKGKYAVIETGGQQYAVREGEVHKIARINGDVGGSIEFDRVLFVSDGKDVRIGAPTIEGATVGAEIVDQTRDKKVVVFKYKRRKDYRKKTGHRQDITYVRIKNIA